MHNNTTTVTRMSRFVSMHACLAILVLLLSPLCIFASASSDSSSPIHTSSSTCNTISAINLCTDPTAIHAINGYVFASCQQGGGIVAFNRSNSQPISLLPDQQCHNPSSVRYVNYTQQVFSGCDLYIRSTTLAASGYNTPAPYCEEASQITVDETRGNGYAACSRSGASSSLISLPSAGGFLLLASEEDCGEPNGVAIDTVNNVLYAACYGNSSLPGSEGVISVDLGNNHQVKHLADEETCPAPDTVAYDPISSTLYAICWGSAKLPNSPSNGVRAYDGTNWRTILNSSMCESSFSALELDPKTGVLYIGCENLQTSLPTPSIYAYFQGTVSVVLTSEVCRTTGLSLDADGTLFAICSSQTQEAISITGILCAAPVTSVVNGGVGTCGSPISACNSCNITCNPGYMVVGASYYCSNGLVIGNQTCMAEPCSAPPVVDTTLIDLTGGDHPCATINLPFTSFNTCSAVCKAHHPGTANDFQCVAAQWQGGPNCHQGTFCWCIGLVLAISIGAMCGVVVILFFVSSGFAVISTFSMMTSAADIVTDLLYISENDFYTKTVFFLVLTVLGFSTIMAIRASWRNHLLAAGTIGWPKPYGVAYLKSVELDQLFKLVGVVIGYVALALLLPLFWMTWFMIAIIAASTKAMSMTAFRHIWLRVWTGEREEVLEQEDIDATDKDKQQEGAEPGWEGDKRDTTPATTSDAADQIDANAPIHQRVDSTVYNTLLLYHLVFESLPMLVLQITNNTLLQSWTPLALASLILSSWCAASNLYVFAFHMLVKKRTIAQVPNDLKSGVLTKVARRLHTSPSNMSSVALDTDAPSPSAQSLNQPLIQDSAKVYSSVSNEKA